MTAYATTVNPDILPPDVGPASGYTLETYLLTYGTVLVPADSQIVPRPITSNYRLAYSTGGRPTIGQLWPRGAGNRI